MFQTEATAGGSKGFNDTPTQGPMQPEGRGRRPRTVSVTGESRILQY
jgi:hypothetical protein